MGLETCNPQAVEPGICNSFRLIVRLELILAPIPEEASGSNSRNGQQTDTEVTDMASRVKCEHNLTIRSSGKFRATIARA